MAALIPALGTPIIRPLTLVLILGGLSALNVRGVGIASRFNTVITVAKLLPLLLLVVIGAFSVRSENLVIAQMPRLADVGRSSLVLLFAFLGLEAALVPSGEIRNPARTIPRSVLTATFAIAVIYLLVHIVAQGVLGPSLARQTTPLAEAGAVAMGPWGRTLILVGGTISMFGYVSGMTLAAPRMLFAFARDGFFPAALARVHPRFRTPHVAIWTQTIIVILLAITGGFEALAIIANGAILLVYVGCALAAIELRRRNVRADGTPFEIPGTSIAPPLALIVIAFMLSTLKAAEWLWIMAMVVGALVLYYLRRLRTSSATA
jgi:basic amino acid/polyamine antiporter, APA family